ncbi:MAG TPA: hypothetical protein VNO26_11085 [Candidatus Limnocylindria bacterium]|nr:hypothetical protein [Candidatus Limnocylindria bacterium]
MSKDPDLLLARGGLGVQKILLKQRLPGQWLVKVKAKRWFATATANRPAASTVLTLTVGTRCFTHEATTKID